MQSSNTYIVFDALGRYLGLPDGAVRPEHRLEGDLGLDAMDLAFVVRRLESAVGREFPLSLLELVDTVDDLNGLVLAWAERSRPGKD